MTRTLFRSIATLLALAFLMLSMKVLAENERKLPYYCDDLQVDRVVDVQGADKKRTYTITGICDMRISKEPLQYQKLWLEIQGIWDAPRQSAIELVKIVAGAKGTFNVIMKCKDDPFITDGVCIVQAFDDSTEIESFAAIFKDHPPIARHVTTPEKAQYLSDVDVAKKTGAPMPAPPAEPMKKIAPEPVVPKVESQPAPTPESEVKPVPVEVKAAEPVPAPAPAATEVKPETKPAATPKVKEAEKPKKPHYVPIFERKGL